MRNYLFRRSVSWLMPVMALLAIPGQRLLAQNSFGASGDIRIIGDFDGDGVADSAVWHSSTGYWSVYGSKTGNQIVNQQWGLPGDIPVAADYDGDGITDLAVWRPSSGFWFIIYSSTCPNGNFASSSCQTGQFQWGLPGDIPIPGNYDGGRATNPAVWRPSNGFWFVLPAVLPGTTPGAPIIKMQFGLPFDAPFIGDFDGDGKADLVVYRASNHTFYASPSTTNWTAAFVLPLGQPNDVPYVGDFDGDGTTDYAVWRPSDGSLHIVLSRGLVSMTRQSPPPSELVYLPHPNNTSAMKVSVPGFPGANVGYVYDRIEGDFDGDGQLDFALFDPASGWWYIAPSGHPGGNVTTVSGCAGHYPITAPLACSFGEAGDIPVPADYDGDGKTDIVQYRPSDFHWYLAVSGSTQFFPFLAPDGAAGDIPQVGDFDGDGKADFVLWRPSNGHWYINLSGQSYANNPDQGQWGLPGDVPVAADYQHTGKTEYAVWRPSSATWFVNSTPSGFTPLIAQQWGLPGDQPAVGDVNNDGNADFIIWRPWAGSYFVLTSPTAGALNPSSNPSVGGTSDGLIRNLPPVTPFLGPR
jgi:hypothetical protein